MKNWTTVVAVVLAIGVFAAAFAAVRGASAPCVNGVKCNIASRRVRPGDVISLGNKAKARGAWDQWRVTWVIADVLFIWQDMAIQYRTGFAPAAGHCERAYQSELDRLQLPPEYRQ
mgnify:CR=1 FL=1